jgi:hypothetical protein
MAPPGAAGDLYEVALARPAIIGILDGDLGSPRRFGAKRSCGRSRGIHGYGAASIDVLRAAKRCVFGMKGIGRIFASLLGWNSVRR